MLVSIMYWQFCFRMWRLRCQIVIYGVLKEKTPCYLLGGNLVFVDVCT